MNALKWVGISLASVVVLYLLVCGVMTAVGYIHMGLQSKAANGKEYGEARYEEIKSSGIPSEFNIYTEDEISANSDLEGVKLYYFPAPSNEKTKYVLVCPGGAYVWCALENEGYSTAAKVNEEGYTAFALVYRVGEAANGRKPLDDLAQAIKYITENADTFNVESEDYAICGYSAGGNLVGLFGSDEYGYKNYEGITKPGAIFMGYPWVNPSISSWNVFDAILFKVLAARGHNAFLYKNPSKADIETMKVYTHITSDYPSTFIMHGKRDQLVPHYKNSDQLVEELEKNNIPYEYYLVKDVNHGTGINEGTAAEDWIPRAISFWENNV